MIDWWMGEWWHLSEVAVRLFEKLEYIWNLFNSIITQNTFKL